MTYDIYIVAFSSIARQYIYGRAETARQAIWSPITPSISRHLRRLETGAGYQLARGKAFTPLAIVPL